MLRSLFELACVLYIIFISSVLSASFGEFCSNDLSCQDLLVCSKTSKCVCPKASFWNAKQNMCLSCPRGWIEWQNKKCLLFIVPPKGGISYQKARNACSTHSGELLQIRNDRDFIELQYKTDELLNSKYTDAVTHFLSTGVWAIFTDSMNIINSYDWCDMEYDNDISSSNDCVQVIKKYSIDKTDTSLCLNHVQCNAKLPYICEKLAQLRDNENDVKYQERIFGFVGSLLGNLFSPSQNTEAPVQQTQAPQIIYQTNPGDALLQQALAQKAGSSNTLLYVGIAAGVVILILVLLCCFCGGGFLLWKSNDSSKAAAAPRPSRYRGRHDRASVDSNVSDASN